MKIGDLVRFTPESWGIPLEDRPLGVVVRMPYKTSTRVSFGTLVDIRFPGDAGIYSITPNDLELLSESR